MKYKVDIKTTELCYQGFFRMEKYTLSHSLFAGEMCPPIQRELVSRGNAVAILLYDPDRDKVVMIEQFRIGALQDPEKAWVLELVAGFQEEGEKIEDVIHREVMEEAGCTVDTIEYISEYYVNPANTSDRTTLMYAEVDSSRASGIHGVREEGEDIKVHVLDFETVIEEINGGKVNSATPIIALQWLEIHRNRLLKKTSSV